MPGNSSFSKIFGSLEKAIRISHIRHSLIISNISNVDTPGYKAKDIDFKTALKNALAPDRSVRLLKTDPRHMGLTDGSDLGVEPVEEESEWNGINWVDIDREMTNLSENNLIYRTSVEILLRKIALIKKVINEGGR